MSAWPLRDETKKGGGAAGRLRQFQMERGLAANVPSCDADHAESDATKLEILGEHFSQTSEMDAWPFKVMVFDRQP